MKKKLSMLLLAAIILMSLSGCFAYYGPQLPSDGVWKSDSPDMYFDFNSPDYYTAGIGSVYERASGEIFYQDGTSVEVDIGATHGDLFIGKYSDSGRQLAQDSILYSGRIKWRSEKEENDTLVLLFEEGEGIDGYTEIEMTRVGDGVFYKDFYVTGEESFPQNLLTEKYGIEDLREFFENTGERLGIREVHEQFPIELTRSNGYTMYRVREGGYYYVFWERPWSEIGDEDTENEPTVSRTLYLSEHYKEDEVFEGIEKGRSKAEEVVEIDPYAEFIYREGKLCSYSYLNVYQVLRIEYEMGEEEGELTVKEKRIYDRRSAPTKLSTILFKDIPYKWDNPTQK